MMSDGPDLVSLLYHADWTRLSLTAEVGVTRDLDLWRSRFDGEPPPRAWSGRPFGPWSVPWFAPWFAPPRGLGGPGVPGESWESPEEAEVKRRCGGLRGPRRDGHEWERATEVLGTESSRFTLLVAPGRRYREQGEGYVSGCDGERAWRAEQDDGDWSVEAVGGPEPPPAARLLRPSWLLTGFTLEPGGPASVSGRDALRVVATPRTRHRSVTGFRPLERVEIAVDAQLGILLRCEEILDGNPLRVTELAFIRVDPARVVFNAPFRPPGGWDSVDDSGPPSKPNGPGWEVAKLTAGLAAGGLGALIKHAPFRPFETATREEADAEMPSSDGPLPADGPPASDEVLRLLHSSPDRWSPGITATLHQWHDVAAMLAKLPDSARRAGFGGLGVMVDAAGERIATVHTIFRLRLGGSGQYRIEPVLYPGRPGGHRPETVICDGERRWRIGEDEVTTGPAVALPREIANLFDTSWLLEHPLTGGEEVATGGRPGYRLRVGFGWPWGGLFFPSDVVVDAELGIGLRCISFSGSQPVLRYELRDVATGPFEPGDFRPDIPAGMPVVEEPGEPPGPVNPVNVVTRQAVKEARSAARNLLGVIRRDDRR
jgi:hypothetical protein